MTTIFGPKNGIPSLAVARLQRWAMLLAGYFFIIVYRSTEAHANADGLSRLPIDSLPSKVEPDIATRFNIMTMSALPLTHVQIKKATRADPVLSKVLHFIKTGWSSCERGEDIKPWWRRRNELTVEAECILLGSRVVVPLILRRQVLQDLHIGHQGMAKMKALARNQVWWPELEQQIEQLVKSCSECVQVKSTPPKAYLHPWSWPTRAWSRIHIDFIGPFMEKMYLVIVDGFSKWPEVWEMNTTTTSKTISVLKHSCTDCQISW